jgi:aspartate 1-decarboxylase
MSFTAHTGETRSGAACVELRDGDKVVLKAYANADETKIRIVLGELIGYKQVLISPDNKCLEFTRKA